MDLSHTSRRDFLKASGALVVSVMLPGTGPSARAQTSGVGDGKPPLLPDELDSWIAMRPDANDTACFGKMDMGQGVDVAIGQIGAEELDVRFERVNVVMGDTAFTCNQGGASGSTGIQNGALTLRYAAAEARRLLLERAVEKLGPPAEKLAVKEGVVSLIGESQRTTTYGELIGGQHFHHKLEWNKRYGNPLLAKGQATPKKPAEYKIVGRSIPQKIVARKIYGSLQYVTDVKVDGMLHARVIRPPSAGCGPVAIDESSISDIPGARVVREKDIVAVVAEHEWDAVRAARALKVTWAPTCAPIGPRCGRARRSRTSRVTASRSWSACLQKKFTRSGSPAPGPTAATTPATPPTTRRCSPSSPASPSAFSTCATTAPAGIRRDRRASIAAVPASMRKATSSPTTSSPGASRGKTWRRTRAIPRTRWPASSPACRPGRRSSSRCRPSRTSSPTSAAVGSASCRSSTS